MLEGEPSSGLAGERPRQHSARGIDESDRLGTGVRNRDVGAEAIAVIGVVEQVECLKRELQVAVFTHLDVFGNTGVHVEVWVAAQAIARSQMTVTRIVTLGLYQGASPLNCTPPKRIRWCIPAHRLKPFAPDPVLYMPLQLYTLTIICFVEYM